MTRQQASQLGRLLRKGPLDLGGELAVQRPLLHQLITSHPLPEGISTRRRELGGVPVVDVVPETPLDGGMLLFFHGGA
ncbi:MAG: hypothetical protein M3Z75_05640 [Actinomycetota bacterium]|nr:hypothetical protein [Actinomycetota bacterium]